ncbi:MAG: bifunctional phosphopantothenoylcysteine decarboxylase/phosphopantothenate--cysteine ligase CoaBC [Acidobacteriaceae bacterium]
MDNAPSRPANRTRVTLGVCGGVAAYKAAELVRALQQQNVDVHVVMTRAAEEFVQPLTFSSLTGHKVITSLWSGTHDEAGPSSGLDDQGQIEHIAEAQAADALVIAPATANVLAKLAHGLADDFLTTMYLATTAPVIVAPAMNVNMWNHPATRANVKLLRERGTTVVEPDAGYLACGMTGSGRLAAIEEIARAVLEAIAARQTGSKKPRKKDLVGEMVLVTAGGTREAIDPVRYLGNRSSGKMGYAIAEAARKRGADVVLVSAPTAISPPARCAFVPVTSAEEMRVAVMEHLPTATVVIKAAAVADFRMTSVAPEKLRREGHLHLDLEPTEDIVRGVVEARAAANASRLDTLVIAFAAEMNADVEQAREKMMRKGADAIVLNDVSRPGIGFDSERNAATFVTRDHATEIQEMSKREMADRILDQVLALRAGPGKLEPETRH